MTGALLVATFAQYVERVRAASQAPLAVSDVCEAAVSARWPGADPIRFDAAAAALRPVGSSGQRYVSQFETLEGARVHFACETEPADDGGWTVSRLSIVSR